MAEYWGHIAVCVAEKDAEEQFSEDMLWSMCNRGVEFQCHLVIVQGNARVSVYIYIYIYISVIYDEEFCLRTVLPGIKVKLILVGSLNCAATYINTLQADSNYKIDSSADIYQHYLAKYPDCLINPTVLFNCNFVWADAEGFNTQTRSFSSFALFRRFVLNTPLTLNATREIVPGEEFYSPYKRN